MTKHIFYEDAIEFSLVSYYIAETIEQAMEMQYALIGENPCVDCWSQCADDDDFMLWLDNVGELKARRAGDTPESDDMFVVGKIQDWAEAHDHGFFCEIYY